MFRFGTSLIFAFALFTQAQGAEVIGYWRMEQDNNAGAGFSVPNEVTGSPLVGGSGSVEALNGTGISFFPNLPNGGAANGFGLNGSANIDGTVAYYPALDAASVTVEFFARTNEGDARLLLRESGTTGLRVDQPSNLRVQYSTASGQVSLTGLNDYDANWEHFAFTYDQTSGVGSVYLDGILAGSNDGPDGEALTWPALADLLVGNGVDGGGPFSGNTDPLFDELRIVDAALDPSQFLIGDAPLNAIPEPSSIVIWALIGCALSMFGYRRWGGNTAQLR